VKPLRSASMKSAHRTRRLLYTSAVGNSTHTDGGRELVLERAGTNDWLPLRVGINYQARIREVNTGGDTPIAPGTMCSH